jgi:hypothetical protein
LKLSVVVPPAWTTLTGTAVLRFCVVDHQMYTSYVPAAARLGVHRYVSVPVPEQLYSDSVPKKFVADDAHQLPVNVRPASCTPAGALSRITSAADAAATDKLLNARSTRPMLAGDIEPGAVLPRTAGAEETIARGSICNSSARAAGPRRRMRTCDEYFNSPRSSRTRIYDGFSSLASGRIVMSVTSAARGSESAWTTIDATSPGCKRRSGRYVLLSRR